VQLPSESISEREAQTFELPFLGTREYLQGTTLFEALEDHIEDGAAVTLRIGRIIESNRISVERGTQQSAVNYDALLSWLPKDCAGNDEITFGISALPRSEPITRDDFDEASLWARSSFLDNSVEYPWDDRMHWIKVAVSLNKAMLTRKFEPGISGQWLFVRLDLATRVTPKESLIIRFRNNVGLAAVASDIAVDGIDVGKLQFSWVKRP
jgi:hypothetical protein